MNTAVVTPTREIGFDLNKFVCLCVYFCPADMQPLSWIPSRKGFTTQTPRPALWPGSKSAIRSEDDFETATQRLSERLLRW